MSQPPYPPSGEGERPESERPESERPVGMPVPPLPFRPDQPTQRLAPEHPGQREATRQFTPTGPQPWQPVPQAGQQGPQAGQQGPQAGQQGPQAGQGGPQFPQSGAPPWQQAGPQPWQQHGQQPWQPGQHGAQPVPAAPAKQSHTVLWALVITASIVLVAVLVALVIALATS